MMDKLMQLLTRQYIMIGRNLIFVIVVLTIQSCCFICEKVLPDKIYNAAYYNDTNSTIIVDMYDLKNDTIFESYEILPEERVFDETLVAHIDEGEDPILELFSGNWSSLMNYIIKRDNSQITWQGPAREMGDSVNHIYNYSSWEIIDYPRDSLLDGEIRFTIYESDFD